MIYPRYYIEVKTTSIKCGCFLKYLNQSILINYVTLNRAFFLARFDMSRPHIVKNRYQILFKNKFYFFKKEYLPCLTHYFMILVRNFQSILNSNKKKVTFASKNDLHQPVFKILI